MEKTYEKLSADQVALERKARLEMQNLQAIEGNPLDAEDIAMFEMFERERWGREQREDYIENLARQAALKPA